MVAARTTDDLIAEVDDQALLPAADGRLTTAEKLRMADRIMATSVSELLVAARYGWWVAAAADVSIVSGTYLYAVPERALAEGIADVLIVSGDDEWKAPEIALADAHRYRKGRNEWDAPYAYTWRDDRLELLPHPDRSDYSLRVMYPRRPSSLVPVSECAVVSSYDATAIVTVDDVPLSWAETTSLDLVSAINGRPRQEDAAGTSVTFANVTLLAGVPTTLLAGDYVCLAGETCVPPIPSNVWPALVDGTTLEVLRALGDDQGAAIAMERFRESLSKARGLLSPRSRGAVKRIIARYSPLRRGRR